MQAAPTFAAASTLWKSGASAPRKATLELTLVIPNRAEGPVRACPVFAEAPSKAEGKPKGTCC